LDEFDQVLVDWHFDFARHEWQKKDSML